MKEYDIFLVKDKRLRSFNMLAWLIISINCLSLAYFSLHLEQFATLKWLLLVLAALVLFIQLYRWGQKKRFLGDAELVPVFMVIIAGWLLLEYYWVGLMNGIVLFLSLVASRRLIVHFGNQVLYPSFPRQRVAWEALSNVILKDGVLTIDFRNNKLSQEKIDERLSAVDEKEFNEFCKAQLNK